MAKRESSFFRTVRNEPEYRSSEERQQDFLTAMAALQRMEMDNMGRDRVIRKVDTNEPIQVLIWSDLHLGSVSGDIEEMMKIRDYILNNDNVGVIFAGDEIEGLIAKYLSTNAARTPFDVQQQIEMLQDMFFEPLARKSKILGLVSEYWGHPGWTADATTINPWVAMVGKLDIPIIINGGQLVIRFRNGYEHAIQVWHNPPSSSKYDELKGQREVMQNTSESVRPRGSVAGHIHRMATAEEQYAGADSVVYYISAGTLKGVTDKTPHDRFGLRLGVERAEPSGQGVSIIPKKGRMPDKNIPFANLRQGKVQNDALRLLDRVESQKLKEELLASIRNEVESAPEITYVPSVSRLATRYKEQKPRGKFQVKEGTIVNPYSKMEMQVPFDRLAYKIRTRLPIALNLIANARIGSSVEGFDDLQGYTRSIAENPHALMVFLRNMIDRKAGKLPKRIQVLDKLSEIINGNPGQTLAIMMDESMRQEQWKQSRGGKYPSRDEMPVAPASYVSTETGVPLIHHLSFLKLQISANGARGVTYTGVLADKLERYGSYSKPEWGLQRLYDLHIHEKPSYVAGGHTPNAGAMTIFDWSNQETNYPVLVAPGWWAKAVDSIGKGNVKPGAEPGQAIIFMPGDSQSDHMQFPTVNTAETEYMHDALLLYEGLRILGLTDAVMKKKRR